MTIKHSSPTRRERSERRRRLRVVRQPARRRYGQRIGCVRDPCFVDISGEIQSEVLHQRARASSNSGSPVVNRSAKSSAPSPSSTRRKQHDRDARRRTVARRSEENASRTMTETDNSPTIGVTWYVPSPFEIDGGRSSFRIEVSRFCPSARAHRSRAR